MSIQQYQNYYPYVAEPQLQYPGDVDAQKQTSSSNYNEFNLFQQNFYPPTCSHFQFEYGQEHEIPSQIKNKKNKKSKYVNMIQIKEQRLKGAPTEDIGIRETSSRGSISNRCTVTRRINFFQRAKPINPYPIFHYTQGSPMPKLQSDIVSNQQHDGQGSQEGSQQTQKQKGQHQQTKKPKKENINTGHWSTDEHSTYIQFLQQYEDIMTSSMMKKTSKIFKQMSELIGTRTPSQCRSHHQKFNPYALRGENGKRLPRAERSRAGRKKKNPQSDVPKAEEANAVINYEVPDPYLYLMYEQQKYYYSGIPQDYWNMHHEMDQLIQYHSIKKEEDQDHIIQNISQAQIQQPQEYEEYLKISFQYNQRNTNPSDYNLEARNQAHSDLL